MFAVTEAV